MIKSNKLRNFSATKLLLLMVYEFYFQVYTPHIIPMSYINSIASWHAISSDHNLLQLGAYDHWLYKHSTLIIAGMYIEYHNCDSKLAVSVLDF